MKFIHIADCHLGGWRDERMMKLNLDSFSYALDYTLKSNADFMLVAGDLFNTSIPSMDVLKFATRQLKRLVDNNIPIYVIAGSHDYSPTGKTMLDVLENAGIIKNVVKGTVQDGLLKLRYTVDEKTGVKITGILGKRGMLDKEYYKRLYLDNLENDDGFKIFMFHTSVDELKHDKNMEGMALSLLPKNFNYYAGGHIHIRNKIDIEGYNNVIYPGPTFPNSFSELEELNYGSFVEYDDGNITFHDIKLKDVLPISINVNDKAPESINAEIMSYADKIKDKIVLIRLQGLLGKGKISDIKLPEIINSFSDAYIVLRNTAGVKTKEFDDIRIRVEDDVEEKIIEEYDKERKDEIIKLLKEFGDTKKEGETRDTFEKRLKDNVDALFNGIKMD